MIKNVLVFGIDGSVRASKFPMAADVTVCDCNITDRQYSLAKAPAGSGHDNFLKGIVVQFDWTFTTKLSVEMERYHFIDFVSSQSTMHRITKFNLDEAYIVYVDKRCIDVIKELVEEYNSLTKEEQESEYGKQLYLRILYSNPCGMYLTARMTTNYQQLKTIYAQRRYHRLPEWRNFCAWIETLPYSEFITGGKAHAGN